MKNWIFLVLIMSMMACKPQETAGIKVVETPVFAQGLENSEVQLVDVRTAEEFADGHIDNAINMDVNGPDFGNKIQTLDKNKPVYVYCRSGKRSAQAAEELKSAGFTDITDLKGGYMSWTQQ